MRSLCRAIAIVSFAACVGTVGPVTAGSDLPLGEQAFSLWSNGLMNEVLRQSLPTPQLLFVRGKLEGEFLADLSPLEQADGITGETRSITALYPMAASYFRHEWFQAKAGWIATDACVLPSALCYVADEELLGCCWVRLDGGMGELPALHLRAPQGHLEESHRAFLWARRKSTPAVLHATVFRAAKDRKRLSWNWSVPSLPSAEVDCVRISQLLTSFWMSSAFYTGQECF